VIVQLPFPHSILWPNGPEGNRFVKSRERKKHKQWAYHAALAALGGGKYQPTGDKIPVRLTISSKPRGPECDRDNAVAALKVYLDGIALAMGVNDRLFDAPIVHFSGRNSTFTIEVGDGRHRQRITA
jgi:crossover junction endodeoxyribonuclease RusA